MCTKFKTLFVLLTLALFSSEYFAQSSPFLVEVENTYISAEPGNTIIFEVNLTNLTAEDLILYCVKEADEIPDDWSCSFCLNICYSSEMDSIATCEDFFSEPLAPGETRLLTIDVFTHQTNIGTAKINVNIGSNEYPENDVSISLEAETLLTGMEDNTSGFNYDLSQNFPNPFNPSTNISFVIPESGNVTLKVYDILGRKVAEVVNEYLTAGKHELIFIGSDLPSGVYFYKIQAGNYSNIKKMILEK